LWGDINTARGLAPGGATLIQPRA